MTRKEYERLVAERQRIISENKSRRLRTNRLPPLPVPDKPKPPMVPVAYHANGDYEGVLTDPDECPVGCIVKWEPSIW